MAADHGGRTLFDPGEPHAPAGAGFIGMLLFLAALLMLFGASLLGYVYIRIWGTNSPDWGSIHFSALLYFSTAFVIVVSVLLHLSLSAVQRQKQKRFRMFLNASLAGAVTFVLVQTPAMVGMLQSHLALRGQGMHLYGLVFFMVLLHALHVVGGVLALWRLSVRAAAGAFDHEFYQPVRTAALYWHFLDGVWIVMFLTLRILA